MTRIEELKTLIPYHNDLYYNSDNPEISDEDYDNLLKEYKELTGEDFDKSVPGEASESFSKVEHKYSVKSLDKIHTRDEVRNALIRLAPGVIQPKLDGLTAVVYGAGVLGDKPVYSTRGNGTVGEIVNHTCAKIDRLGSIVGLTYRAEVFMPLSNFKEINERRVKEGKEPFKNPRNAAAGMIRALDTDKVEGLTYMAYNILGSTVSESEQLAILEHKGLNVVPLFKYTKDSIDEALDYIMSYNVLHRTELDYEIDGLVIKSDIENSLEVFGETGHHPKNAVAFKFPSQGEWTKLTQVVWQVGRTGQVSPVAEFEPVDILGSTVTRATLHNYGFISAMGITNDCELHIIKANDVIPRVNAVRDAQGDVISLIEECPICGEKVSLNGANLFCTNIDCRAFATARVAHMAKRDALNIDGLSIKTVEKMYEAGLLNTSYDIFKITAEQIKELEGFAAKSAKKTYDAIQGARLADLDKFMYAAGVPLVGRTASKDISELVGSYANLMVEIKDNKCKNILGISGIGKEIVDNILNNYKVFEELHEFVETRVVEKAEIVTANADCKTFVLTGKMSHPRSYFEELITSKGHKVTDSISKNTDFLVNNDVTSTSSKNKKAQSLGVPIINEDELLNQL